MQPVDTPKPKRAPGPSRLVFRVQRAWRRTWVRRGVLIVLPLTCLALTGGWLAQSGTLRTMMTAAQDRVMETLADQEAFSITAFEVTGVTPDLEREIMEIADTVANADTDAPAILKIAEIRRRIGLLGAISAVRVTVGDAGLVQIAATERHPAALWRDPNQTLWQVGRDGVVIARAMTRAGYPDLPVVVGAGATAHMDEAMTLYQALAGLSPRLRAIVRVGMRRWDIVLDQDLVLMLPEENPIAALERIMGWHYGEQLLERGLSAVDLRLAQRPTLRMRPDATEKFYLNLKALEELGEET